MPIKAVSAGYAVSLTDHEYAECFDIFKQISTEWRSMQEWLTEDFMPRLTWRGPLEILSIGSGTGDFDLHLMTILLNRWPIQAYVGIDPNQDHNQVFQTKFRESALPVGEFQILPETFPGTPLGRKFDLIHLTHCLYYIPDRRQAIVSALDHLKNEGALLIFHQTPLGINELQRRFLKQVKGHENEMFSSKEIYQLLEELPVAFKFDIIDGILDVSECFVPDSPRGQRLLDFFLECRVDTLPASCRQEIIQFLRELVIEEHGRLVLFHPVGIFWVSRPEQ